MSVQFPTTAPINPANHVQGPTTVWYAPYVAAGAEPAQGNIVGLGLTSKDGFEWDFKQSWSETESDQFTTAMDAFLTKQEFDLKFTIQELSPANVNVVLGVNPASLIAGSPTTQKLGEPFDVTSASSNPSMRATYRQWLFRFPAPGYDNTTNPIGKWAYMRFFKAYVFQSGAKKFSKDGMTTVAVTLHALADATVSTSQYKIGEVVYP